MIPVAQAAQPLSFWQAEPGSTRMWLLILAAVVVGFLVVAALLRAPTRARPVIVSTVTFLGGLYFVLHFLWPTAQDYSPDEVPRNAVEGFSFWLQGTLPSVTAFAQSLGAMLLGIGIYSLLSIHLGRLLKRQKDWFFSLVFTLSMAAMILFGYWDWISRLTPEGARAAAETPSVFPHFAKDLLFGGLFINMDAVMFSIIAFFIFSAAYRAFRIRSVESTILLGTALIVMLGLMGGVVVSQDSLLNSIAQPGESVIVDSLRLPTIRSWIQDNLQSPSIRAMEFGLAIGGLAMALRLWLSIEKGVSH
ncbi:MAG: hypothetical protein N2109_09115 [Fimbriimonadales bacterium]|nr:hypothetical protein [Fimbriimonadales bacterium]